jgi:hypothetical protein
MELRDILEEDTMDDFWQPVPEERVEDHSERLRCAAASSLEHPALVWRQSSEQEPIFVRLLSDSHDGVTFICPLPLDVGESIGFAREKGTRPTMLHVARCDVLEEDIYRVGAHF